MGQLVMDADTFEPGNSPIREQLVEHLGLQSDCSIEDFQGFRGGLNDGVWFVVQPGLELVLKLVRCYRVCPTVLTEAENFMKLSREYPSALSDQRLSFPLKMFSCFGPDGAKRHDLIVMRKVRGERLAEMIARKWYGNQVPSLHRCFERVGASLSEFHARYANLQHGDLQPSNIFYDEESDEPSFIDIGGMGVPTIDSDLEHMATSMRLLGDCYSHQLVADCLAHFERGYKQASARG